MYRHAIVALFVVAVTLFTFIGVTRNGFLNYDDDYHVYENPDILHPGGSGLQRFWQRPYEGLYIPVTYSLWWLLARIQAHLPVNDRGLSMDPRIFHYAGLLIHIVCVIAVFALLRQLAGNDWAAGAGALLFGIHPVQVETVAWVSEMKGLLGGCFSMLAIWQYSVYASAAKRQVKRPFFRYSVAAVCFSLAMLSKPSAIVAPFVAGILAHCLAGRPVRYVVPELAPWVILALPLLVVTKAVQPDAGHEFLPSLFQRLLIAGDTLTFYAYKVLLPVSLGLDYGRSPQAVLGNAWIYLTGLLPYAVTVLLLWRCRRSWSLIPAAIFIVSLTPVLGLVTFDYQHISTVADRYLYMAMLGPALAVTGLLAGSRGWVPPGVYAVVTAGLAVASIQQIQYWRSSETLFRHALQVNEKSWLANNSLGLALRKEGRLQDAADHYRTAIRIRPAYARAHMNLGIVLLTMQDIQGGLPHLRESVRLEPNNANARNNLGVALSAAGDRQEALQQFREALRLEPRNKPARANFANALYLQGDVAGAIAEFRKTLELDPDFDQARQGLHRLQPDQHDY